MATFDSKDATGPVRFDLFDVTDLLAGTPQLSNEANFLIGPSMSVLTAFGGTGFTYSGGLFVTGTINRIESVNAPNSEFVFEGLNMPVAQFRNFVNTGNSQGFLAAALAGDDTLTGSKFDDYLHGFAGNDSISGDAILAGGNDTLDGGVGADTMAGSEGSDLYFVDNAKDLVQGETDTVASGIDTVQSTVTYELGFNLEHLFLTGKAALNGTGNDLANQIVGNAGANKLRGLDANDSLEGGGGNDTLDGGLGDDVLRGGAGNDTYFVDSASDQAAESTAGKASGFDVVFSLADITLGANIENLTLIGSKSLAVQGNDLNNVITASNDNPNKNDLRGENGNDTILGGAGTDLLLGGAGADKLSGGAGNDSYFIDDADKVAELLSGSKGGIDLVSYEGTIGYTLGKNLENLTLSGSTGATFGTGNGAGNEILGNTNANTLDGRTGADVLMGQDGDDTYIVDNANDIVDEFTGVQGGIDTVRSSVNFDLSANGTTVLGEVENLVLLGKAVTGAGNELDNKITGNAGKNSLSGGIGNDTLDGGAGNDTLTGGDGNDAYVIDSKFDFVNETGADAADQIISSKISVNISAAALAGIENVAITGKMALTVTGNVSDNVITGNAGANKLFGLGGVDTLIGGAGNDTLDGGVGSDRMVGGDGNDTYFVDHTLPGIFEVVDETGGSGIDTVISTAAIFNLGVDVLGTVEILILAAGAGDLGAIGSLNGDKIAGNEGANLIDADLGNDSVTGGGGNDTLRGNDGSDSLVGDAGNDELQGGIGDDTITGGLGNDKIAGEQGNDSADGGAGNDSIGGTSGNDTIVGGLGDDELTGGEGDDMLNVAAGNDVVKIDSILDGHDLISSFDGNAAGGGQDKIDLTKLFDSLATPSGERSSLVLILDNGASVDIRINADGDLSNGYELNVATLQTPDAVTLGQDVILG